MPTTNYNRVKRPVIIPVGPSIAYIELTQGQFTRIDSDMAEELGRWNWYAHWEPDCRSFYAWRKETMGDGRRLTISMQQQILGLRGSEITGDHIDRDSLNNTRANLREATWSQQNRNQRKPEPYISSIGAESLHVQELALKLAELMAD